MAVNVIVTDTPLVVLFESYNRVLNVWSQPKFWNDCFTRNKLLETTQRSRGKEEQQSCMRPIWGKQEQQSSGHQHTCTVTKSSHCIVWKTHPKRREQCVKTSPSGIINKPQLKESEARATLKGSFYSPPWVQMCCWPELCCSCFPQTGLM